MSNNQDDGGWLVWLLIAGAVFWFAYEKWWKEDNEASPTQDVSNLAPTPSPTIKPASGPPISPSGMVFVTELEDGTIWQLDSSTIKGPRERRLGWLVHNHKKDKTTPYRETKEYWLVDCELASYRILRVISYKPDGKPSDKFEKSEDEAKLEYAVPGSNAASVMRGLCNRRWDVMQKN